MLSLNITAELAGVSELKTIDLPTQPYEYSFKIQCTSCRDIHPNWVSINQFKRQDVPGGKGEANFVFKCRSCKRDSSINLKTTGNSYTEDKSGKPVTMLKLDCRGVEAVEFKAEGEFICKGLESNTEFKGVDLEEGEWYDYDEKAGDEVSITEVKWEIIKS
ncbi:DUF866 domain protein [Nadsonia fulvescens var. elongata DSM 6958]|uniref:DUF866 domain protein n=1 Tax=Nadsonia fulvescens var. elongata DSM 6958 TaxID=857566 RepID=A0A1E3PKT9_9ASCO|nr:DUF866 domain protein [Nadsonia fulvescens var. elongata DSM 6958]